MRISVGIIGKKQSFKEKIMAIAHRDDHVVEREGQGIDVFNPVTSELIGTVPQTSADEVALAVERARHAQQKWAAMPARERARILAHWSELMWQNKEEAMAIIRQETGKNDAGAFIEIVLMDMTAAYYTRHGPKMLRSQKRQPAFPLLQTARVYYKPHGVVGMISPWNYPMLLALIDVVPALIAGNAVVFKPSEITPYSALYAVDTLGKAGLPENVAQVVTGDGVVGAELVKHVDYICFTGSTEVGRKVAQQAAARLIPYSLELGGKDPMIVLKDADLDIAASYALQGACENAGQTCTSVERIYVEDAIYDEFISKLREQLKGLNIGSGDGLDAHMGSLTNERELLRAERHIEDAINKGAELISGGQRRPDLGPLFFEPALLANVDHSMEVMQEETFGPLIPIMRVADADEAVRLANDGDYGLSGSVFTANTKAGEQLATRLNTGDISVNRVNAVPGSPRLPWGGQKSSGIGRRGGPEGLMRFVSPQSIVVDRQIGVKPAHSVIDPVTYRLLNMMHTVRKWMPFL